MFGTVIVFPCGTKSSIYDNFGVNKTRCSLIFNFLWQRDLKSAYKENAYLIIEKRNVDTVINTVGAIDEWILNWRSFFFLEISFTLWALNIEKQFNFRIQ